MLTIYKNLFNEYHFKLVFRQLLILGLKHQTTFSCIYEKQLKKMNDNLFPFFKTSL